MKKRVALIISAGVTAFVLVAVGGILYAAQAMAQSQGSAVEATQPVTAVVDPADPYGDREARYRQIIEQANNRIEQANALNKKLSEELAQARQMQAAQSTNSSNGAQASNEYPVSERRAVRIALSLAPGAELTRQPELVNYRGRAAYEVELDAGVVLVDANSGRVLYAGANAPSDLQSEEHSEGESD